MADNGAGGIAVAAGVLAFAGVFGMLAVTYLHRPLPFPKPGVRAAWGASDEVNIDVYLDGSKSMRQFLKAGAKINYLHELLIDLETTMNSAHGNHSSPGVEWSNATVNYWNFGAFRRNEVDPASEHPFAKPLKEGDLRRLAESPDGGFDATRTPIEKPITDKQGGAFGSKLKVIITDLYQSGSNTATFANPLANEYLDDETKAVDVIAVRNPFAGIVDDLPGCGTLVNAADTMPFYLIVAGPAGDVRHAVEKLKATGLSAAISDRRVQEWFFSKSPAALPTAEQRPTVRVPDPKSKGHPWVDLRTLRKNDYPKVEVSEEAGVTELLMRKGSKAEISWATMPLGVDGQPIQKTELDSGVTVSRSKDKNGTPVEDVSGTAAVELECVSGKPDGLCLALDEGRLKTPMNYLVALSVRTRQMGAELPESLKPDSPSMLKWNIEVKNTPAVCKAGFPHLEGVSGNRAGMTPQLSQFLNALYQKMLNTQVRLATYPLYVKAR